jgi:hypothetical protein
MGIFLRMLRYALGQPVWGDEAFLGINILDRSYLGLLKPLEYIQIAPLGFLWMERWMYEVFGPSEYAMRAVPTLAGIAGVVVFALWARKIADPLAAAIATGILAVSDLSIRHAVELKPYSLDFLTAVVLLYLATGFWMDRRRRWLRGMIVCAPIAVFMSLSAMLVVGGLVGILIFSIWRVDRTGRKLVIALAGVVAGSIAAMQWGFLAGQFAGSGRVQQELWVWPPLGVVEFAKWFAIVHSGNYFGYPLDLGSPAGGIAFWLMVIGLIYLWRSGSKMLAILIVSPIVTTTMAAVVHRYPYGQSPRLGQHLVGPICLLMGVAIAGVVRRFWRTQREMERASGVVLVTIAVIGVGTVVSFGIMPTLESQRDGVKRSFVAGALRDAPPDATVVVLDTKYQVAAITRWYIHLWTGRIAWGVPVSEVGKYADGPVWIFNPVTELPGLDEEIERQVGTKPERMSQSFGPGEGACEVFIYRDGVKDLLLR